MKLEGRKGLVRGSVTIYQNHGSFDPITAYTLWFRHDTPNLESELQKAVDLLMNAYRSMKDYGSAMISFEWKDYKKI